MYCLELLYFYFRVRKYKLF